MAGRRTPEPRSWGQHLLDRSLAAELVRDAAVRPDDLVVEIGAGTGVITLELAGRCRSVMAIEIDPRLVGPLRRGVGRRVDVRVVHGDARSVRLPSEPFRVVGNLPFAITTDVLRRLLGPRSTLVRADLIVQLEVARKRTVDPPRNALSICWAPWWTFDLRRRIPARRFSPPPSVDAALLVISRREPPWLAVGERGAFERFVRRAFQHPGLPMPRALGTERRDVRRALSDLGLPHRTRPVDLRNEEWPRLYRRLVPP